MMDPRGLKTGRINARLTQKQAAARLGISQPYLSQLERGLRPMTPRLARSATALYRLPATALPIPRSVSEEIAVDADRLARELSGLGYPGFAHLHSRRANPAATVLEAIRQRDLDVRVMEALPWVLLTYADLDWGWLIRQAKLQDAQNRLGFLVAVAKHLATNRSDLETAVKQLTIAEQQLERARLAREDTLCRDSMPEAERRWLEENRSALAQHWNLRTGLVAEQLPYAAA